MRQDYVICKGKRYNSGDTINILWYTNGYKNAYNYTGVFIDCDEEKDEYRFTVDSRIYCFNKVCFWKTIVNDPIYEKPFVGREPRKVTLKDELNIDWLLIAWAWYIITMVVGTIFYDRLLIWVFASIIFFRYRNKKLKEAGYK